MLSVISGHVSRVTLGLVTGSRDHYRPGAAVTLVMRGPDD